MFLLVLRNLPEPIGLETDRSLPGTGPEIWPVLTRGFLCGTIHWLIISDYSIQLGPFISVYFTLFIWS